MFAMYYFWYKHYHSSFWTIWKYRISYAFVWVTLVPVGPGVKEGGPRYGAQKTTCRIQSCLFSWPGVRTWVFGKNPAASADARNTTDHSVTQKHHRDIQEEKLSVERGREELDLRACQDVAVWQKSNLSAESKPVQCALLQYLCLSVTPREYLMLGEGGRQEEELLYRQLYCFMYVPLYILPPVFQNRPSGSRYCVQL